MLTYENKKKPKPQKTTKNKAKTKGKKSPQKHGIGLTWNINVDALWFKDHQRRIQEKDSIIKVFHVE